MSALIAAKLGTGSTFGLLQNGDLFSYDPDQATLSVGAAMTLGHALTVNGPATFSGAITAVMGTFMDLSIDRNLTVGGSARIGKNLHVDGELIVSSILSEGSLTWTAI